MKIGLTNYYLFYNPRHPHPKRLPQRQQHRRVGQAFAPLQPAVVRPADRHALRLQPRAQLRLAQPQLDPPRADPRADRARKLGLVAFIFLGQVFRPFWHFG